MGNESTVVGVGVFWETPEYVKGWVTLLNEQNKVITFVLITDYDGGLLDKIVVCEESATIH